MQQCQLYVNCLIGANRSESGLCFALPRTAQVDSRAMLVRSFLLYIIIVVLNHLSATWDICVAA